ncbi:hypothetical protein GCM10010341_75280 [Streptomyces noursei]|nr:hypothetical protein GCM10010341_75280 [Streptomyces noursei]
MEEMGLACEGRLQREKLRLQATEWFEEGIARAEIARRSGFPVRPASPDPAVRVEYAVMGQGGRSHRRP